jgi:hypothetical protein
VFGDSGLEGFEDSDGGLGGVAGKNAEAFDLRGQEWGAEAAEADVLGAGYQSV